MSAALTREPRIRQLLPLAIVERWGVRRFAHEARISFGSACEVLRFAAQRSATALDEKDGALHGKAAEIREAVCKAVKTLVRSVEAQAAACEGKADAASLERLSRTLETALRVSDSLDGLSHQRALQTAFVKRADGETLARMAERPSDASHGGNGSVFAYLEQGGYFAKHPEKRQAFLRKARPA